MRRCDVLIAGGGPAGSSCAGELAGRGYDVVVLDQARFPRDKTCAGWITPPVFERLGIAPADYSQTGRVMQPITGFRVWYGAAGGGMRIDFGRVVSYGIRRCEFDHYLLERCGAEVHQGVRIESVERQSGQWSVNGGAFAAPVLVGAGGHSCPVARWLGARVPLEPAVLAQEAEWRFHALTDPAEPELMFFPDRSGYAWCFQKQGFANIGFGRMGRGRLEPFRAASLAWLRSHAALDGGGPPCWHGHAYLTADASPRRIASEEGALLTGDAAGLADAHSGEGIRPAVESGLMAAAAIVTARGRGSDLARRYEEKISQKFRSRRGKGGWPVPDLVARSLMSSPWFVREVVLKRWFLQLT
jgi:menaquinone-9 beta-reductase